MQRRRLIEPPMHIQAALYILHESKQSKLKEKGTENRTTMNKKKT